MDGNGRFEESVGNRGRNIKVDISLYDETANSGKEIDRKTAEKCLELWDIMFERQLGSVREISRKLMER